MGPHALRSAARAAAAGEEVTPVSPPGTYAEWLPLLERFRDGDDTVIDALRAGTLEWTNVVAERWTARFSEALNARLQSVSTQLQRALDHAHGDAFAVSSAVLAARRALSPLHAVTALSWAPDPVRQHFAGEVRRYAERTQSSLESSAKRHRADVLLKALRDNPLTTLLPVPVAASDVPEAAPRRGRRILE